MKFIMINIIYAYLAIAVMYYIFQIIVIQMETALVIQAMIMNMNCQKALNKDHHKLYYISQDLNISKYLKQRYFKFCELRLKY